ncbi:MAG: protein kinase family protein [Gammaproteobacteria bacterium]|nr:protein kinase family protein [Gammaproteobacteria bacterium]
MLRWFSDTSTFAGQKDLDVLIGDEHVDFVRSLATKVPSPINQIRIDIYSTIGKYGSGFTDYPYYPKYLATRILKNAVNYNNFRIPSAVDYLYSFIFHVVFHKAEASGLPVTGTFDHQFNRYADEIHKAANAAGVRIDHPITLENMAILLKEGGWFPPSEWIRRASSRASNWLSTLVSAEWTNPAISVFIVREQAANEIFIQKFVEQVKEEDLSVLAIQKLTRSQKKRAALFLRNGNWGKGPYASEGGGPHTIVIIQDEHPTLPADRSSNTSFVTNDRFSALKEKFRAFTNNGLDAGSFNGIHSSDDNLEAIEYLSILFSTISVEDYSAHIAGFNTRQYFETKSNRSTIELKEKGSERLVVKTFNPSFEKYFLRELIAYITLQDQVSFIPKLMFTQVNQLVLEYIDFDAPSQNFLIMNNMKKICEVIHQLWELGYAHLDLHPDNFVIDKKGKIYLVDYEFLHKYERKPGSIYNSYDILGHPDPLSWGLKSKSSATYIDKIWKERVGMPLSELATNQLLNKYKE